MNWSDRQEHEMGFVQQEKVLNIMEVETIIVQLNRYAWSPPVLD